jgi:hypothetical protein
LGIKVWNENFKSVNQMSEWTAGRDVAFLIEEGLKVEKSPTRYPTNRPFLLVYKRAPFINGQSFQTFPLFSG